ncbi:6-phosphogluconate dehydrogenase, decarboxylating [Chitinispirillum alkaliphilum]|nr:6-phosphogluconate dehydrogenase, decarboxylating [Chitinispirillum alkaliphilum]
MADNLQIGIVGLGRIGGNLVRQAVEKGIETIGFTSPHKHDDLVEIGMKKISSLDEFIEKLQRPRKVFLYVPSGYIVDKFIDELSYILSEGDIIVDGGNSYWGDSVRRSEFLKERKIHFVDLGTSGGTQGARNGACFMAGGDDAAVNEIKPLLHKLALRGGFVHAGPSGAGHFVKLVHNGIEFGMLQAIGEGVDLLENYKDRLNIADVLGCWRNGSVIRSWLVDLMEQQYRDHGGLEKIPAHVEDTGEVNWLVSDALQMEVAVPVITASVMQLFISRDPQKNWAKAVAMMRNGFGEHGFGVDERAITERTEGRTGDFYRWKNNNTKKD